MKRVGKRKHLLAVVVCLIMVFAMSMTANAAKKREVSFDKYLKKGKNYTILLYSKNKPRISIYSKKSKKASVIARLGYGDAIVVNKSKVKKGKKYQWIPVTVKSAYNKSRTGYIQAGYVVVGKAKMSAINTKTFSKNKTINNAIKYGMKFMGTRFQLPGSSLTSGIDCASFVVAVYRNAGKSTSYAHTDSLQTVSYSISKSRLKAGDLIFYREYDPCSGPIGHVAIYIGNGFVLHASGHVGETYPNGGICIKRINYGNRKAALYKRLYGF